MSSTWPSKVLKIMDHLPIVFGIRLNYLILEYQVHHFGCFTQGLGCTPEVGSEGQLLGFVGGQIRPSLWRSGPEYSESRQNPTTRLDIPATMAVEAGLHRHGRMYLNTFLLFG